MLICLRGSHSTLSTNNPRNIITFLFVSSTEFAHLTISSDFHGFHLSSQQSKSFGAESHLISLHMNSIFYHYYYHCYCYFQFVNFLSDQIKTTPSSEVANGSNGFLQCSLPGAIRQIDYISVTRGGEGTKNRKDVSRREAKTAGFFFLSFLFSSLLLIRYWSPDTGQIFHSALRTDADWSPGQAVVWGAHAREAD